jgi:hypothetical protein
MKCFKILLAGLIVIALFGCAHPISISPNIAKIEREPGSPPKIKANVGYIISADMINIEITSPGGGGDSVRYFPYKELEAAYQIMLLNVFEKVTKIKSADENKELSKEEIKFVLEPVLLTNSGSTGFFTWAPTNFTVDLTSNIRDASGKIIGNPRVIGNGQVDFILDMKGDYGLVGRLAMEDALLKMQRALLEIDYENIPTRTTISLPPANSSKLQPKDQTSVRLEKLKGLFDKGLVTREEYERKMRGILDSL